MKCSTRRAVRIKARLTPLLVVHGLSAGCSILSIKSPEIPLSSREQQARLLTHDYAAHFTARLPMCWTMLDKIMRRKGEGKPKPEDQIP